MEDDAMTEILPDASPEELAKHYLDQGYEDEDDVIKALIEVSATELANDPGIRQWVRFHYRQYASRRRRNPRYSATSKLIHFIL